MINATLLIVLTIIIIAFAFDFTNGFHDAANAIATSVATRALAPRTALLMAAVMNFVGALLGTGVAETIGSGIVDISDKSIDPHIALFMVLAGLIGAVVWNLITWRLGLPSSSSHALIGGLAGAGLAASVTVQWWTIVDKVVIPMFLSPFVGFFLAYIVMTIVRRSFANFAYASTMRRFRYAQTISAAATALGHGLQDAQKTMGVVVLSLVAGGYHEGTAVPTWVKIGAAGAISLGTYTGGWRIMKTLGSKIIDLNPAQGFVAESVASSVLYTTAFLYHAPISTTHTITSAIMGAGAAKRLSAVRWAVTKSIVGAWFMTMPAAAAISAIFYAIFHLLFI